MSVYLVVICSSRGVLCCSSARKLAFVDIQYLEGVLGSQCYFRLGHVAQQISGGLFTSFQGTLTRVKRQKAECAYSRSHA